MACLAVIRKTDGRDKTIVRVRTLHAKSGKVRRREGEGRSAALSLPVRRSVSLDADTVLREAKATRLHVLALDLQVATDGRIRANPPPAWRCRPPEGRAHGP